MMHVSNRCIPVLFQSLKSRINLVPPILYEVPLPPKFSPLILVKGASIFVNGAFIFLNGTFISLNGAFIFLNGAFIFVNGAFNFVNGVFTFVNGAFFIQRSNIT